MSSNRRRIIGVATAGSGAISVIGGQLVTNRHCLRLRKVTMYKETSSGWARVDEILSSAHGAWGFRYQSNDPDPTQVKFTVTRDTRRNGSVVCKGTELEQSV